MKDKILFYAIYLIILINCFNLISAENSYTFIENENVNINRLEIINNNWSFNNENYINITIYDFNNNTIDAEKIETNIIENITYNKSSILRENKGVYKQFFYINNSENKNNNLTLKISIIKDGKLYEKIHNISLKNSNSKINNLFDNFSDKLNDFQFFILNNIIYLALITIFFFIFLIIFISYKVFRYK